MAKNPYELITDGAQAYLDVRPGYPDELVAALDIYQGVKVADIGAGTGKLTAQICSRTAQVWAVEPSAEMESAFFQALPDFPRSRFVSARAENTGFSRREFDIVSYGQCWHWLDAPAASREAARILRANGKIAIFCNQLNVSIPWVLQLTRIMRSGDIQKISKPPQLTRDFGKLQLNSVDWTDYLSVREVMLLGTTRASWIKSNPEDRARMQDNLRWYLCDELGYGEAEKVPLPYQTYLWLAEKKY